MARAGGGAIFGKFFSGGWGRILFGSGGVRKERSLFPARGLPSLPANVFHNIMNTPFFLTGKEKKYIKNNTDKYKEVGEDYLLKNGNRVRLLRTGHFYANYLFIKPEASGTWEIS